MKPWKDKNSGKHPSDPEYDDNYNAEEDFDRYLDAAEERYELEREREAKL